MLPAASSPVDMPCTASRAVIACGWTPASKPTATCSPLAVLAWKNATRADSALTAEGGMLSCRTLCGYGTTTGGGVLAGLGGGKVGVAGSPLTEYQVASE